SRWLPDRIDEEPVKGAWDDLQQQIEQYQRDDRVVPGIEEVAAQPTDDATARGGRVRDWRNVALPRRPLDAPIKHLIVPVAPLHQGDGPVVPIHEERNAEAEHEIDRHEDGDGLNRLTGLIHGRVADGNEVRITDRHGQ